MAFIESIKAALPDYAKDTKLNLDAVLLRSTLDPDVAMGCAVAALAATGNGKVLSSVDGRCSCSFESAMTAASIMAQNNVWYPFVEMAEDPALSWIACTVAYERYRKSRWNYQSKLRSI
jgi:lipoyl-dependent peroxiredoxin subunit D